MPANRLENVHPRVGSPASATPATDGERVYVFFGSVGLVGFDFVSHAPGVTRWQTLELKRR
ncbi:MAG: hypothetical protein HY735_37710 [Verrucomicrobia bacterium]|nr:hypothetical protein [Verrucomicrobiota bacterium]